MRTIVEKAKRAAVLTCLFVLIGLFGYAQHYIGEPKTYIISTKAFDTSVKSMTMQRESYRGEDYEILTYRYKDRNQYYYINPDNRTCEAYAALFFSRTAYDSLVRVYDSKYKRVPHPDTTALAWIEYGDGINYKRILRDFNPPTCLAILAIIQRVTDDE